MRNILLIGLLISIALIGCKQDDPLGMENPVTVEAGNNQTVYLGDTVYLKGSYLGNTNNQTYPTNWYIAIMPANSESDIYSPTDLSTYFIPDKVGNYIVRLELTDQVSNSTDSVLINVINSVAGQPEIIADDIVADRVLIDRFPENPEAIDYLVTNDVKLYSKLTIEPGVKIAFNEGTSLTVTVDALLSAQGNDTEDGRIYFTGATEESGFWKGIIFQSKKDGNILNHTSVMYAGYNEDPFSKNVAFYMEYLSRITITNSFFQQNLGYQIYMDNDAHLVTFDGNYIDGIDETNFTIGIPASEVSQIGDNNLFRSGPVVVTTADINSGVLETWKQYDYYLLEGLNLTKKTGLELKPYTKISVAQDKQIAVIDGSYLVAEGTEALPVLFQGAVAQSGYWKGIYIANSDVPSNLTYASIWHTGSSPHAGSQPASIHLGINGKLAIEHSSINAGNGEGIEATSSGATLLSYKYNTIRQHIGYPLALSTENVSQLDSTSVYNNNSINKIRIDGNNPIRSNTETLWRKFAQTNMVYLIKGLGNDLTIQSGLRIDDGVIIEMENNSRITVEDFQDMEGYLKTSGTPNHPVIIRNVNEIAGSWYGITFSNLNVNNSLNYTHIFHGGKKVDNSFSAVITIDNSPEGRLSISNSIIGYSGQHGISVLNDKRANLQDNQLQFIEIPETEIYAW